MMLSPSLRTGLRLATFTVSLCTPARALAGPPTLPPLPGQRVVPTEQAAASPSPEPKKNPAPQPTTVQRPTRVATEPPPPPPPPPPAPPPAAQPTFSPAPPSVTVHVHDAPPIPDEAAPVEPPVEPPAKLEHRGLVLDATTGLLGCTRAMCAGDGGHGAQPGVFVGGFLGGNIGGFVELGFMGGWGQLRNGATLGQNPLGLWGLSPDLLSEQLAYRSNDAGAAVADMFAQVQMQDAKLTAYHVAPALRVHFVPRGRAIAYVGAGAGYGGMQAEYGTNFGPLDLSAHGISVPAEAGLGVMLSKNFALVARFDYVYMHYLLLGFDHQLQDGVVPMSMLDQVATQTDLGESLPHFWTATVGIRTRLF